LLIDEMIDDEIALSGTEAIEASSSGAAPFGFKGKCLDTTITQPSPPPARQNLKVTPYERHIDMSWDSPQNEEAERTIIYRSTATISSRSARRFAASTASPDSIGKVIATARYKIATSDRDDRGSQPSQSVSATTHAMADIELLTVLATLGPSRKALRVNG
jgi:hypothetical protein